jgi:hypothetical protein
VFGNGVSSSTRGGVGLLCVGTTPVARQFCATVPEIIHRPGTGIYISEQQSTFRDFKALTKDYTGCPKKKDEYSGRSQYRLF